MAVASHAVIDGVDVTTHVSAWTVSAAPDDHPEAHYFHITVEHAGRGRWAVRDGRACLSADGSWDHEPQPSSRTDEWLAAHRFDLDTAHRLAREAAPHVTINGVTAADLWDDDHDG